MARGRNHFQAKWLQETDSFGDLIGEYLEKTGEFSSKCKWCQQDIYVGNQGLSAIRRHYVSRNHTNIANLMKKRNGEQYVFEVPADTDDPVPEVFEDPNVRTEVALEGGKKAGDGILNYFSKAPVATVTEQNNNKTNFFCLSDQASKLENSIILQSVHKNVHF